MGSTIPFKTKQSFPGEQNPPLTITACGPSATKDRAAYNISSSLLIALIPKSLAAS